MNVVLHELNHLCPKNVQNIPPTLPNFPVDQGQPNNHIPTQNTKFHHPPSLSHYQRQHQNMNDPNGTQTSISQKNDDSTASRSQNQQYSINERPVLSYESLPQAAFIILQKLRLECFSEDRQSIHDCRCLHEPYSSHLINY